MVLIVDDDLAMCRFMELILRSEGFEVETAQEGGLAILQSQSEPPEVVIVDLTMPFMDGRDIFERARQAGYNGPILFSGHIDAEKANLEIGGQGAIKKPIDPDQFVLFVRHSLSQARQDASRRDSV